MTDSNATERLLELLDERGVVYETYDSESMTWWNTNHGSFVFFARERDGKLLVETSATTEHSLICTPEQAVAATLGAGECVLVETNSYSNSHEVIHVLECSACGKTCEHVNGAYPRCPHCGGKAAELEDGR